MAGRDEAKNRFRSKSPSLSNNPRMAENRRARSRSRAKIDSQLVRRVDQIPAVHNTIEYIASTYNVIKDSSPIVKENLQRTEDLWNWFREKAEDFVTVNQLLGPLKSIDNAAAVGLDNLEKSTRMMRNRYEQTQKEWLDNFQNAFMELLRIRDNMSFSLMESVQIVLDYVEEKFDKIMLPPSIEITQQFETVGLLPILFRLMDMTYRMQTGIVMRAFNDLQLLQITLFSQFDPFTIWPRTQIVWEEIFSPVDKKLSVQQSSKLTNIDKQIVKAGRVLFAAWQNVIFMIKPGPEAGKTFNEMMNSITRRFSEGRQRGFSGLGFLKI